MTPSLSPITKVVKYLKSDNSWDAKAILESRENDDGDIVACTATKTPLFFTRKDGVKIKIASHGNCYTCGHLFHENYLHSWEQESITDYPIIHVGRECKDCWKLPWKEGSAQSEDISLSPIMDDDLDDG